MTIHKVTMLAWDFWKDEDKGGYVNIDKYFTSREKAKQFIEAHRDYIYRGRTSEDKVAIFPHERPAFTTEEITVE